MRTWVVAASADLFAWRLYIRDLPFLCGIPFGPGGHQQAYHKEVQTEASHAGGDEGLCGRDWTGTASSGSYGVRSFN